MIRSLWNGAAGMLAQSQKVDVIANNIANVNTVAYKKNQVTFSQLLDQNLSVKRLPFDDNADRPITGGAGVNVASSNKVFDQGPLQETQRELDLAIMGKGFFEVELPGGQLAYTRGGSFQRDREGFLVTASGYRLSPPIQVPEEAGKVVITATGGVTVTDEEGFTQEVATIELFTVTNESGLKSLGDNLYQPTAASGPMVAGFAGEGGRGIIKQGYLEGSNVQLLEEMTAMLQAQRAFEINSRSIVTADEMWSLANNLRR